MRLKITGQGVAYALAVLLAHRLRVEGFEAYVVASAAFIVMVTFAPRGFDKYALRLLPALLDRADWGRAHGYLKFGVRHTLWTSLFVGLAVGIWARTARDFNADTRLAIIVSCISLPAGALVHFALEVLTAVGRAFTATAIFRIAVPAMALAIACLLFYLPIRDQRNSRGGLLGCCLGRGACDDGDSDPACSSPRDFASRGHRGTICLGEKCVATLQSDGW